MNPYPLFFFALAFSILAPASSFAQAGSRRGGYSRDSSASSRPAEREESKDEDKKADKKEKKSSRRKNDKSAPPKEAAPVLGTDKESIEAYLQQRLGEAKKAHREQDKWGRGLTTAWASFWSQMYEDRKSFEIRIARQRLNLFESLDSLDPTFHSQTIADFERLQTNIIKSFESQQHQKMQDYFAVLFSDLKAFQGQQQTLREQLAADAMAAWKAQKAASESKRK